MRRPKHRAVNRRDNFSPEEKMMAAPLGMEDKGQFINLPLINTLRNNSPQSGRDASEEQKSRNQALASEPSFYEKDLENRKNRYKKYIADRQKIKNRESRTHNYTCLNQNTNTNSYRMLNSQSLLSDKKDEKAVSPLSFNHVLKRRKSR